MLSRTQKCLFHDVLSSTGHAHGRVRWVEFASGYVTFSCVCVCVCVCHRYTGAGSTGPNVTQPNTSSLVSQVRIGPSASGPWTTYNGSVITYLRAYTKASNLSNYK